MPRRLLRWGNTNEAAGSHVDFKPQIPVIAEVAPIHVKRNQGVDMGHPDSVEPQKNVG
ncbi:hypothetical protein PAAG_03679 [Paracoccidioides lutzii Pb01]|uniref:Uncharacterized protein n=1 Tax=Paracoccidioides lutzii (strain ATCC MYA-826 / Pb01) TaxID=502779 RepID=C1GYT5_PARBA|nr:hypothetical protein PAAG_03679 [Paracoccidioides lutzii Pb01]EEH41758.2 hypothetical protein PAAG_03679 [Paracoccidioides lutzii Pb01]